MENKRQKGKPTSEKILEAISTYTKVNGYPPTIRELGEMVGLKSTSTVYGHLERLGRKGKVSKGTDKPRTIRVLGDNHQKDKLVMHEHNFEVVKTLGMLSDHIDERLREINIVKYKHKEEVGYDIRTFAADYKCDDEGITLTAKEIIKLRDLLNGMEL